MTLSIWQGNKVRLRAFEAADWETFFQIDQDTEIARLCYFIPFPRSPEASQKWAAEAAMAKPVGDEFCFVIETLEGEPVGTINTHHCDARSGTFQYGLGIHRDHWRKGYAREAIYLVLRYFFSELRYQKVNAPVYAFNQASIQLHERLGFKEEGRLRRMIFTGGEYHDEIMFGMTLEEFAGYPWPAA
ncbi:MAG: N-acetyltransferase [Chloroflexota bacterium]|nr:MAG: N-acetyltransferase [Chloroflexota bacterium]